MESYKAVFTSPRGRHVLWDLMKEHHILMPTYESKGPQDVNKMLINEGERAVVLRILKMLDLDVKQFRKQIEEGMNNENSFADDVFR